MAERLLAIDYRRHGDKSWSKAALLGEYFRRAAAYDCGSRTPFFDIALCVDPSIRAAQQYVDSVVEGVHPQGRSAITTVAPFMLHWAALRADPSFVMPLEPADPFEPLILMFERDGGFHTENGEVNLEYRAVPMRRWRERSGAAPMPSFAPEVLDEIDRAGSLKQFGYVMGPDGKPVG
ncbi:hypothetical protein [Paractinoplanes durhamensis]|nr:hypothetical protein [Actinoplanes durhamensis]